MKQAENTDVLNYYYLKAGKRKNKWEKMKLMKNHS
jgi:hypothetical protein